MARLPLVKLLILGGACAPLVACSSTIRWPNLRGPGPATYQRAQAEQTDPFPIPDMGPEVVGGRPREFDKPRDEVRRSRQFLESVGARPAQMVPVTPIPVGQPFAVGPAIPMSAAPPVSTPQVRY
jgi:hypothetical protein